MRKAFTFPRQKKVSFDMPESGFTLIELLIVFSIMTILSSIGIASFVGYSRSAQVDTNMKEFKSLLYTARSRALSQIRDSACFTAGFTGQGYELRGYQVVACCSFGALCTTVPCTNSQDSYELQAVYGLPDGTGLTAQTCVSKKFTDPNITFSSSATKATYFFFSSITAAVTTNASGISQLGITSYGITKLATVSATGVIQ